MKQLIYIFLFSISLIANHLEFLNLHKGWNLAGGVDITNLNELNTSMIWKYNGKNWLGYSNTQKYLSNIKQNYKIIDNISSKEGFWIYSEQNNSLTAINTKFIPFLDISNWPPFDINQTLQLGLKDYIFSFVNSKKDICKPAWGTWQIGLLDDTYKLNNNLKSIKQLGGNIIISIGGATTKRDEVDYSLAKNCNNANSLKNALEEIKNSLQTNWLDFDIEGDEAKDSSKVDKYLDAIKLLQAEDEKTIISFTLAVMPNGFADIEKNIIQKAISKDIKIKQINLMLMDFSKDLPANDPTKDKMFEYAKSAIESVNLYLKESFKDIYPTFNGNYYYKIGSIVMIGQNDINNEWCYLNDFKKLRDFAKQKSMPLLSFWAIHRDKVKSKNSTIENSTMLDSNIYGKTPFSYTKNALASKVAYIGQSITPKDTFYIQLQGDINNSIKADIYDIDLFDTSKEEIKSLKKQGKKVICYFSAGSYENWREDKEAFKSSVIGKPLSGWDGENWLDIRDDTVIKIMKKRMDIAKEKGCDGVDPDNVNGYENDTGFDLSYNDQFRYNSTLAIEAHKRGLLIGLKNDLDQISDLVDFFDFEVNEQCHIYNECDKLEPFIKVNKAVLNIEYDKKYLNQDQFSNLCKQSNQMNFDTVVMPLALDGSFVKSCR